MHAVGMQAMPYLHSGKWVDEIREVGIEPAAQLRHGHNGILCSNKLPSLMLLQTSSKKALRPDHQIQG
jgi:hypothetical protein